MIAAWTRTHLYYGWLIAGTLAVTQTIAWGILYYSFSVFLTSMEADLGLSRAAVSGAFSLALLCSGIIALPVGRWIDQHGARGLMTVGSILATLLFLAAATVTNVYLLYLVWAGIGLCMALILYEPAFAAVAVWFVQRRTAALAIITFVAGLASTIFLPLAELLRQEYGWRGAMVILALLLGVVTIPLHALVLRRHPHDLGLVADGGRLNSAPSSARPVERSRTLQSALHDRAFWWMVVAFVLTTVGSLSITVHFIPLLLARGFSPTSAAQVAGIIGAMQVVGRIIFTPLSGRWPSHFVLALLFGVQMVAVLALLLPQGGAVIAFVILFGATAGATTLARPAIIAEHYGSAAFGQISGVLATCLTGARALAPVGAGAIYVLFGSYLPVIAIVAVLLALAALGSLFVGKPAPPT